MITFTIVTIIYLLYPLLLCWGFLQALAPKLTVLLSIHSAIPKITVHMQEIQAQTPKRGTPMPASNWVWSEWAQIIHLDRYPHLGTLHHRYFAQADFQTYCCISKLKNQGRVGGSNIKAFGRGPSCTMASCVKQDHVDVMAQHLYITKLSTASVLTKEYCESIPRCE